MHIKSLFCLTGADSQYRFMAINVLAYVVLLIITSLVGASFATAIVALPVIAMVTLSAKRRVKHVQTPVWFALLPALPLTLFWFALALDAGVTLLLVSALIGAAVLVLTQLVLPSAKSLPFDQFGYAGPHGNQTASKQSAERRRVEPTLDGQPSEVSDEEIDDLATHRAQENSAEPVGEQINWQAISHKWTTLSAVKQKMLMVSVAATIVLAVILSWLNPAKQPVEPVAEQLMPEPIQPIAFKADAKAEMPDGFSVILSDDAVILEWLGERGEPQQLWSLETAIGDKTCQVMEFNNGASYRPIRVELLPSSATRARFSPLDTEAIITDIAMRGNLKLCGYQFSLKGSQAALAKSAGFIDYL
ncbi:hypothetical protein [Shewanella waksmanii]|uniref:hypothetical protein n=1 Tax=Shewanella waksmanii TaxID=213783 RepID=UPI0037362E86